MIELKRGYDLPQSVRRAGPVPIISSSGITDYHDTAMADGPGVVTGRYGTLGEVFYIREDFWPLNTALYVRDFKGNDPLFISYFLRTLPLASQNAAGAVPGVNRNHLHMLSGQERIASILSAYDDLIEVNQRRIAILEEMARRLFDEWFVHFCFPGYETVELIETDSGVRPKSWKQGSVATISEFIARGISPTYDDSAIGVVVNQKCIRNNCLSLDQSRRQSKLVPQEKIASIWRRSY